MKDNRVPLQETILLIAGLAALLTVQLVYRRPAFGDEQEYLKNVALLHQYGFGKNFLVHLGGSAGPLYSIVHFIFEPFTRLQWPGVRWINVFFLLGAVFGMYRIIALLNFGNRLFALYAMAIPITYVITGQALTEMPAFFFFTTAVYLLVRNTRTNVSGARVPQLILAGICMSLAIIGRQPYLLTLAALPVLFFPANRYKKNTWLFLLTVLFSVALPCYVFYAWQGLAPTIESQLYKDIARAGVSYRLDFFLLCLFYFAVCMLLTAPHFFLLPRSSRVIAGWVVFFLVITAANFAFKWIELFPERWLLQKIFPGARQAHVVSIVCGSVVMLLSVYFIACLYVQLQRLQFQKEMVFFALALLLIAASCIKITWGYSSRYAGQGIPLLLLLGSCFYRPSRYNAVRIVLGMAIGLVSLVSYFLNPA